MIDKRLVKVEEFPDISPREFKFIRQNSGITLKQFAQAVGKLSRSTIWNWENQKTLRPYQIKLLMSIVPEDLFNECRKLWGKNKKTK